MRAAILGPALLLLAACGTTMDRAPRTWHDSVELLCHEPACSACRGSSLQGCPPCRATGKVPCTRCKDGRVACTTCKGDGRKDGKPCKTCEGSGRMKCPTCDGTRLAACGHCDGKARIHCLRPMAVHDTPPRGEDAWPPGNEPPSAPE